MKIAKALLTRSEQARTRAEAASDAATREHWLGIAKAWQVMSEIHEHELAGDFEKIQIEAVRARIQESRTRVGQQMRRIESLRQQGARTDAARALLNTFCESLSLHCECLEKLIRESRKRSALPRGHRSRTGRDVQAANT